MKLLRKYLRGKNATVKNFRTSAMSDIEENRKGFLSDGIYHRIMENIPSDIYDDINDALNKMFEEMNKIKEENERQTRLKEEYKKVIKKQRQTIEELKEENERLKKQIAEEEQLKEEKKEFYQQLANKAKEASSIIKNQKHKIHQLEATIETIKCLKEQVDASLKEDIEKLKQENKKLNKIIRATKRDRGYSVTDSEDEDED